MWFIVNIFRYGIRSAPLKPTRRLISFFADSQDKIDGNVVIFRQCNQNRCRNISFAVFVIGIRSLRAVQNSGKMCLRYFVFFSKTFQILILHQSKLSRFHTPYYKVEQSVLDVLRTNRSEFLICRIRFAYTKKEPYRISIRKCSVKALIWESGAALCHAFPLPVSSKSEVLTVLIKFYFHCMLEISVIIAHILKSCRIEKVRHGVLCLGKSSA